MESVLANQPIACLAGGIQAISRWLSKATPPEHVISQYLIPKGITAKGLATMSTYASLHYHVTFSTKYRKPLIHQSWEPRLHEYLGGIVKNLKGFPQGIGGVEDHVHLLIGLKTTHQISDFMRELKKSSSQWIQSTIGVNDLKWQEG